MKEFKFAGIRAGIKKNGKKDLGLIFCEYPADAAALFTKNKVVAAPVILGRQTIERGKVQAILVNSGNANCFTGEAGLQDAKECARLTAEELGIEEGLVQVSSTGVIGQRLPMERFVNGIPDTVKQLSEQNMDDFATAILTTDLQTKTVVKQGTINDKPFTIKGIAKGSGMIRPDMATMLAFVLTDAHVGKDLLKACLVAANEKSFNRITVDGDTSTNDTIFAMASGSSKVEIAGESSQKIFAEILTDVCIDLAKQMVKDGEGATKLVQILVKGAASRQDAFLAAEAIAHSNLVKTAVYGEDPNWGRITAAAGRSGAQVEQDKMDLYFDEYPLVQKGVWLGAKAENQAAAVMKHNEINITLDLNLGTFSDAFWFCDFSENYVKINAEYRS